MFLGEPAARSVGSFYEIWHDGTQVRRRRGEDRVDRSSSGRSTPLPEAIAAPLRALADAPRHGAVPSESRRHDDRCQAVEPSPQRIAEANITAFAREVEGAARRRRSPTTRRSGSGRSNNPELFWRDRVGVRRRHRRRAASACSSTGDQMPGAHWFPDAPAQLRAEPARTAAGRRCRRRAGVLGRGQGKTSGVACAGARAPHRRSPPHCRRRGIAPAIASPRTCPTCPRRSSRCSARQRRAHLVVVLARLRRAGRARSLRTDRAARALHRRRLLVQRQADRDSRQGRGDRRASCLGRARRRRSVSRRQGSAARNEFSPLRDALHLGRFIAPFAGGPIDYARLPFDHPLYILYSSGTTGVPKCIVHGAGGTLLQHLKEHLLHGDVKPGDRLFYFTTCGWMMWNWLASGLAAGRDAAALRRLAVRRARQHAVGLRRRGAHDALRHVGQVHRRARRRSALVPRKDYALAGAAHDVVDRHAAGAGELRLRLPSASSTTSACRRSRAAPTSSRCFVLGNPTLPVWRGEIQCRGLGMAVDVFDDDGNPVRRRRRASSSARRRSRRCRSASGTIPDGAKYRAAYFERFPGRLVPRRLRRDHRARRRDHLRPLGCDAQSRRRAHRHRGDLSPGRAARRGRREPRHRPGLAARRGRRRARRAVRAAARRHDARRRADRPDQAARSAPTPRRATCRRRSCRSTDIPRTKSGKIVELAVRNVVHGRDGQEPRGARQSGGARAVSRPGGAAT